MLSPYPTSSQFLTASELDNDPLKELTRDLKEERIMKLMNQVKLAGAKCVWPFSFYLPAGELREDSI